MVGPVLPHPFLLTLMVASASVAAGGPAYRTPSNARVRAAHARRGSRQPGPQPACSEVSAFVEKVAAQALKDFNVTGMSVGVVCNHSVAYVGGFGWADAEATPKQPASKSTLYQVASNSKAFVSERVQL